MKFTIFVVVIMRIAINQLAFCKTVHNSPMLRNRGRNTIKNIRSNVPTPMNSTVTPAVIATIIPGTDTLIDTVAKASNISKVPSPTSIFYHLGNSALYGGWGGFLINIADRDKEEGIVKLPKKFKNTVSGKYLNDILDMCKKATSVLLDINIDVDSAFTNIIAAGKKYEAEGLDLINVQPNTQCETILLQAKTSFIQNLENNAKSCVQDVFNIISDDVQSIEAIQTELIKVFKTSKLRVDLFLDISHAGLNIPIHIDIIHSQFPICEQSQLDVTLEKLLRIIAKMPAACMMEEKPTESPELEETMDPR